MDAPYDAAIDRHYADEAQREGARSTSTMADVIVRDMETELILDFVRDVAPERADWPAAPLADVGCGNGYTLGVLANAFTGIRMIGVEKNAPLRRIAESHLVQFDDVTIRDGDIRDAGFLGTTAHVLICQRVLINLLDHADQTRARDNLITAVRPGGFLLFIEAFASGLDRLNIARAEFNLPPIEPAPHNLYLPDDFFEHPCLETYCSPTWAVAPNHLSTHYYVTRVLHAALTGSRPFKRNSEFVRFLSSALPTSVGDYSPLQVRAFRHA